MFVFNDYQVGSLVSEEFVLNEQFAVVLTDPKPKWLNIVLDMESSDKTTAGRSKFIRGKYLKVIGGSKEIFLKNLSEALFIGTIHMDEENTIIINDSSEKCVCNDRRNCLFLETWTPLDVDDDFLVRILGQWLLRLHTDCICGQLWDFVNRNCIRVPPLTANSQVLIHIANGMPLLSRNLHKKYKILGVSGFEIPKIQ